MKHKLKGVYALLCLTLAAWIGVRFGAGFGACALIMLSTAFAISVTPSLYRLGDVSHASPNTGESLSTMSPDSVRELWQSGVDVFEQSEDFFAPMEGGPSALIWEKTDTSKGKGQKIHFTVRSGYYKEPHRGEERFDSESDFEKTRIADHDLEVDFLRHAVRNTERMEEVMGMRGEIISGDNEEVGKWLGRLKTELMFMTLRERLPAENIVYAGGHSQDTLVSADVLDWDEIIQLGVMMKGRGGQPAQVGRTANGQPIWRQVVIACTDTLLSLDLDPNYKQALAQTVVESQARFIFDGGYTAPKGHIIKEYTPIEHDGVGAIGSPLIAQARLGVAIEAGTTTFDIKGGGDEDSADETDILFFKYFPGHAYKFLANDQLTQNVGPHYCLIVNPPNAETDPNKIGMYRYTTGNNGNKITITHRLAAADSGVAATVVGSVTWNTGVWSGKHTDVHPEGALILPCNAKGQVFGDSFMLGRRCAYRGYGKYRNKRTQQDQEGGHIMDRYITTVIGQALRKDRRLRVPGAMRIRHAVQLAGVPLPVIT